MDQKQHPLPAEWKETIMVKQRILLLLSGIGTLCIGEWLANFFLTLGRSNPDWTMVSLFGTGICWGGIALIWTAVESPLKKVWRFLRRKTKQDQ